MSITQFAGPFPTDWASPSQCTSFLSEQVIVLDGASSCLPKDFDTNTDVYYSPGTACPSGYTAHDYCSRTGTDKATTVTCCPVRGEMTMWCVEDPKSLRVPWVDYQCTWSAGNAVTEIVVTSSSRHETYSATITMSGGDGVNAYGIRMVYEASDLSKSTSTSSPSRTSVESTIASSTSSASSSSTSQADEETGAAAAPATDESGSSGGLSTGAIAAIGVVVPLVVIAILVGVFLLLRRRKKQADEATSYGAVGATSSEEDVKGGPLYGGPPAVAMYHSPDEVKGGPLYGAPPAAAAMYHSPDQVKYELPARSVTVSELPAEVPISEFYASPTVTYSAASAWTDSPSPMNPSPVNQHPRGNQR